MELTTVTLNVPVLVLVVVPVMVGLALCSAFFFGRAAGRWDASRRYRESLRQYAKWKGCEDDGSEDAPRATH